MVCEKGQGEGCAGGARLSEPRSGEFSAPFTAAPDRTAPDISSHPPEKAMEQKDPFSQDKSLTSLAKTCG